MTTEQITKADVAEHCGIENPAACPDWTVPVDVFEEQDGMVACEETGRQPDPPWIVVARYQLPYGEKKILSHEAYADVLERWYELAPPPRRRRSRSTVRAGANST